LTNNYSTTDFYKNKLYEVGKSNDSVLFWKVIFLHIFIADEYIERPEELV